MSNKDRGQLDFYGWERQQRADFNLIGKCDSQVHGGHIVKQAARRGHPQKGRIMIK